MKFLAGVLIGISIPLIAIYCFFVFGGMPVATEDPPLPMEKFFVRKALQAAMKEDINKEAPFEADELHFSSGAKKYLNQCAGCHGIPGDEGPRFAKTMFPKAPQLFTERGNVTDDPVGETYWKVKNGIRLTGMPAFKTILNDKEIWEISLLLARENDLPSSVHAIFSSGESFTRKP